MLVLPVLLAIAAFVPSSSSRESRGHVSVVLLGATGDLARKYLWQGLFRLYLEEVSRGGHTFTFHGGAQADLEPGRRAMYGHLKDLACPPDVLPDRCAVMKDQFLRLTEYRRLKTEEDFAGLDREIRTLLSQEGLEEAGRIFYFSVPPFAYAEIARHINSSCRPPPGAWIRVALEKPFGRDLRSAQKLAEEMKTFFREEEMYRVDHYLGKQAVAHILPFRDQNRKHLDPIWNKDHVDRVEIVLKETVDVKNRTAFYEEYGVLRDVLQNHLTEALMLVAMELPANVSDAEDVLRGKLQAFASLRPLERKSAVLGQYQGYNALLAKEDPQKKEEKGYFSTTPTFAGVLVHLENLRWEGVPFILVSGKALDERVGYVRVVFKNRAFCTRREDARDPEGGHCKPKQLVFYVGHGELGLPAVLVSRNLFEPFMPGDAWRELLDPPAARLFGQPLSDFRVYVPVAELDPYTVLISRIYRGEKESFVATENLLASWAFWTPLLTACDGEIPRTYPGGRQNGHLLDFEINGAEVAFVVKDTLEVMDARDGLTPDSYRTVQSRFRQSRLVTDWPEELVARLASDMEAAAAEAVGRSGAFHVALSGGSTPLALFKRLASRHYGFPWRQTHVWMADERCVPLSDPESNFGNVYENLLRHVRVPYANVHPMPVHLSGRLCVEEDRGAERYAAEMEAAVSGAGFDLVLLGVGADGHTASIFPHSEAGLEGDQAVVFTESPSKPHRRMTLSLAAINGAKRVWVLAMGKGKHEILTLVSRAGKEPQKWPVSGVDPASGQMAWYVDYEALLG